MEIPEKGKIYSINEGSYNSFPDYIKSFVEECRQTGCSGRYIGSLVADFHRNLLKGGIYLYPPTQKSPNGKLRLMYECNPLAFIAEQAGGMAWNGQKRIMEITPDNIHQQVPFYVGSKEMVESVLLKNQQETNA